jgi:hypothetical protein
MALRHDHRSSEARGGRSAPAWATCVTVVVAAACGASTWFVWWAPLAVAALAVGVPAAIRWLQWLVRRDARSMIALWLIFGLNRSLALLVPPALHSWALYLDDIALAVALGTVLLTGARLLPGTRLMALAYLGLGVFLVSGVVGALMAGTGLVVTLVGTWLSLKLLACLAVANQFQWRERDLRLAVRVAVPLIILVVLVAAVQWVSPETVHAILGTGQRQRLGVPVITSIFSQPAQYAAFMMLVLALLLARFPLTPTRIGQSLIVGVGAMLSLRLKALVDIVLIPAARVAISPVRRVRVTTPLMLLTGATAAILLGSGLVAAKIGVLFGTETDSPRQILYKTSARIAHDFFPFGGGFGSFASEASVIDYSPLYARYGLSGTYGFRADNPTMVHDASWATVLAEGGVIGTVGCLVGLTALLVAAWRRARVASASRRDDAARATLLFLVPFLSDSLTTPQLFIGFSCISLALLFSISSSSPIPDAAALPRAEARPGEVRGRWSPDQDPRVWDGGRRREAI